MHKTYNIKVFVINKNIKEIIFFNVKKNFKKNFKNLKNFTKIYFGHHQQS